jgi:hypothetical protein
MRTCQEALRLAGQTGDRRLRGALLLRLADCAERLGRLAEAETHRAESARLLRTGADDGVCAAPSVAPSAETATTSEGRTCET